MSKLIELKFSIDIENNQEVNNLINILEGFKQENLKNTKTGKKIETAKSLKQVADSITKVSKKALEKEKTTTTKEAETLKKSTETANTDTSDDAKNIEVKSETVKPVKNTPEIKIEDIRAVLAKKVGSFRPEIKAMLTELGANNVTTLNPDQYKEFLDFLNSL